MPHLVDYFVVCGLHSAELEQDTLPSIYSHLPPLCRCYSPRILAHYPENLSWNPFDESAVRTLCMPDSLFFSKNLVAPEGLKFFHSFLITRENGTHAYGSSLTFYEEVRDTRVLNTLESLQTTYRESRMIISPNSDREKYFSQSQDKLFVNKCICFVTSKPIVRPCKALLEQLYAVSIGRQVVDLPLESYIYNVLYEVPLPPPGKRVKFSGPLGRITWRQPSLSELPLCDYSFRQFFQLFGVRNVLKLVTCILLEHQLLLKSFDYERLMLCAHCATALIFPFTWQHVFVPILPTSQRGFLDAPVPYIMGLKVDGSTDSKYLSLPNEASLCQADVDEGIVECPDDLPMLPDMDRLVLRVSEEVQEHEVDCSDVTMLPHSPETTPSRPSIIEALKIVKELSDKVQGSELKKLLAQTAMTNPHIPNLINIASRAGIKTPLSPGSETDEGAFDLEDTDDVSEESKSEWDCIPEKSEISFKMAIREVFASYFVEHFANYENFIIVPRQSYDQWLRNREQFQNFDKTAFISDQPTNYRPFYSAFLETAMFCSFIDQKIVMFWEPERAGQNMVVFDSRVEIYRDKSGLAKPPTTPGSRSGSESCSSEMGDTLGMVADVINETAPFPHPLTKQGSEGGTSGTLVPGLFPQLDSSLLQMEGGKEGSVGHRGGDRNPHSGSTSGGSIAALPGSSPMLGLPMSRRLRSSGGGGSHGGSGFSSHSHAKFVNQLWRESRLRVKHMLGSSGDNQNSIEENTHIAYLCDLLERIWGHGLKKRESKSPLWAHLMAYAETQGKEEFVSPLSPSTSSPPHPLTSSMSSLAVLSTGARSPEESPRSAQNLKAHFRRRRFQSPQLRAQVEAILHPPSSSLVSDLLIVHNMRQLKTDVGHARAWVRLVLEKKSLSRHLSQLLANEDLCNRRYREYAFLRTDEEREQFLYHLLTLTARDFTCFTTGFSNATMTYRILVVGEGKHFGLSTACLYVNLAGQCGETGVTEIARGEYQCEVTCTNLGPLTCLRVGHDNSGLTPSLFVEMVLVHNVTTGQTYRFNSGHWLARSEDDGSVERFLVAERVPLTMVKSCTMSALNVDSVLPSSPGRRRATRKDSEEKLKAANIKFSLKSVVEKIRTLSQSKNRDTCLEMLQLIHGPSGFVRYMEQVFHLGFRNSRKFQKRLFIWDLLERVHETLSAEPSPDSGNTSPGMEGHSRQMFLNAVPRINSNNPNIGKDEKAVQFFSIGIRDHYLAYWIELISQSPILQGLYEPDSFLRDRELLHFLLGILSSTHSVPIRLEPLLTQGL